jgi:hypothetical protein
VKIIIDRSGFYSIRPGLDGEVKVEFLDGGSVLELADGSAIDRLGAPHKHTSSEGVVEADALIAKWLRGELGRGEFVDSLREALCPETMPGRPQAGCTSGNQSDLKGERELPPGSNLTNTSSLYEKWRELQGREAKFESAEAAAKFMHAVFTMPEVPAYFNLTAHAAAAEYLGVRDLAMVARCAELLHERGHAHAANSLRKMAREGKIT